MAATGFVSRWKGKVLVQLLGLNSGGITLYSLTGNPNLTPNDLLGLRGNGSTAGSTATTPIPAYGLTSFSTADGTSVLDTPVRGYRKTLEFDGASTGAARKVYSGSTLITFDGTNDVLVSTAAGIVSLLGLSTARWLITGNTGSASLVTST